MQGFRSLLAGLGINGFKLAAACGRGRFVKEVVHVCLLEDEHPVSVSV